MLRVIAMLMLVGVLFTGAAAHAETCGATVVQVGDLYFVHDDVELGGFSDWIYQENGLAPDLQRDDDYCMTGDPLADTIIF